MARDRKQLEEQRAARARLFTEVDNLKAREAVDGPSEGLNERLGNLHRGIENADGRIEELQAAYGRDMLDGLSSGRYAADEPPPPERRDEPREPRNEVRDAGLRTVERYAEQMDAGAADNVDRLIRQDTAHDWTSRYVAAVGSEDYRSAFWKVLADPQYAHLKFSAQEVEAVRTASAVTSERDMSIGVTTAGGFAVPFQLDPTVMLSSSGAINPVRGLASVRTISTNQWRGVSSDGVTSSYSQEATAMIDGTPVLAQPIVTAERWTTFVPYSWELAQDWGTLQSELVRLTADARDVMDATQFFSGAGTASFAPQGILTGLSILGSSGTTFAITTAATATMTATDLWSLKAAIPPRFTGGAVFAAPSPLLDKIWRLVGSGATAEAVLMEGRSGPLMGKPTAEWSFNAGTATPTSGTIILGGNFQAGYLICDRLGLTAVPIPALMSGGTRPTGQAGLAIWGRTGASVVNPNAFRVLIGR